MLALLVIVIPASLAIFIVTNKLLFFKCVCVCVCVCVHFLIFCLLQMLTDGLWIIVMFLSASHSDGTHSLQCIHCRDTDAEKHFYKPDEETHSS